MKAKIGVELLRSDKVKPKDKPFEIFDTELKGFTLRIQPDWHDKTGKKMPGAKTYLVRYRLPNGKQTRTVIGSHKEFTPAQARDKATEIRRAVKDGIDPAKKEEPVINHTFGTFLTQKYAPWVESHRKDGKATVKRIKVCFAEFNDLPLAEISAPIVEKWRTERLNSGRQPSTCDRDITALKALLSKAVELKCLANRPLGTVKQLQIDKAARVRYLSKDEEFRLIQALDDREEKARTERATANTWRKERSYPLFLDLSAVAFIDHLKPMILVSLNTGLRWGELVSLTWDAVNIDQALLTVKGNTAKSGKTRHIPLNATAMDTLKGWKEQSPGELVFPGRDGNILDNVNRSWSALLKTAKIENFRWHDMRHSFASWLVMAGVDLNTVRELLGHSDLKMTLRYAHLAPEHKAAAVAMLVR